MFILFFMLIFSINSAYTFHSRMCIHNLKFIRSGISYEPHNNENNEYIQFSWPRLYLC